MTQDEVIEMAIQGHASTREAIRWAIKQALAQPEQEPFGYLSIEDNPVFQKETPEIGQWKTLYTTPPQRTWVGLTDDEIKAFNTWHDNREEEVGWVNPSEIVAYIEAKLKEKNT